MFEFLKNLFKPKDREEEVKLEDLESWFKEEVREKIESLKADLSSIFARFDEEVIKLRESLSVLEKAGLQNPNISIREKQVMEGNRQVYLKKVSSFIDNIALEKNPKRVKEFCSSFETSLNSLNASTAKPYFILQEFFANESKRVAQSIKNLDKHVKGIKAMMKREDIQQIENIEKEIKNIFNRLELKEGTKRKLKDTEEGLREDEKIGDSLANEIEGIKKSDEMRELQLLKKETGELDEKINSLKAPFLHNFAITEAAFKKYSKIALDEKTVLHYLEDPLDKLLKDTDFKILKILESIKENVNRGVIELKDRKKKKTLQTIEAMDKEYFENFIRDYAEMTATKNGLNKRIEENNCEEELRKANFRFNQIKESIENKNQAIKKLKTDLENIKIEELIKGVEGGLLKITDKEVRIIV